MSNFITNRGKNINLSDRLKNIIQYSSELKFLVGYFYFSGWNQLYQSFKNNQDLTIKILVGLEVDRYLTGTIEFEHRDSSLSNDEHFTLFMKSLGKAINSPEMDKQDFYEQVDFFIDLLTKDKLIIRKTSQPNHAKLYLFRWENAHSVVTNEVGRFITGSSNLTKPGLSGQNEFNVEISDYGFTEAEKYFDDLWFQAIPISEASNGKDSIKDFLENKSISSQITPFEAYTYFLKSYLELQQAQDRSNSISHLLSDAGFMKYTYQIDAVNFALDRIEKCKGVIISDVVGLGKSVIAALVAKLLNKRGLILCPPGLIGDQGENTGWWEYLNRFKLYDWDIKSVGKIEELAETFTKNDYGYEVIIVDEAHRFRNQDTSVYQALSEICRNKEVMLLTATPFNNTPADIFSLLKLFLIPGRSLITLEDDLEAKFRSYNYRFKNLSTIQKNFNSENTLNRQKAQNIYDNLFGSSTSIDISKVTSEVRKIANDIKRTISPVVIRRNRIDLQSDYIYKEEIKNLSTVSDPKELFFELSQEQLNFYDKILKEYFGEDGKFHGAIYKPDVYEKEASYLNTKLSKEENRSYMQQNNLFHFMRRLLVKRFESSFGAFKQSIDRFLKTHEMVLSFIQTSEIYFLDRKLINSIYNQDDDMEDFSQEQIAEAIRTFEISAKNHKSPKHSKIYKLDKLIRKDDFLNDIASDIELFKEISGEIDKLDLVNKDPKRDRVVSTVKDILSKTKKSKRKVVIFSEYTDTVNHLKNYFKLSLNNRVLVCNGTITRELASEINNNFNASAEEQKDDYDLLITSDKLSEGVNLNRAGLIINYDIPWNPTRVIQRVGRINRIGKKVFNELYIYNFFPTKKGADHVRSREIAEQKMFLIHNALGEDAKIFNPDEVPSASEMYKKINTNPEQTEEESFDTLCRNKYKKITDDFPEVIKRISSLPNRIKTAKLYSESNTIIFRKKGISMFAVKSETRNMKIITQEISFSQVLDLVECPYKTTRESFSQTFWDHYSHLKEYKPNPKGNVRPLSLQSSANNSLQSILKLTDIDLDQDTIAFIHTLITDIKQFKTLPYNTLRELTLNEKSKNKYKELKQNILTLKKRLGNNYLDKVIQRQADLPNEVIVAIENQCVNK
jgi:superfamily II DNA or RNA helicase